MNSSLQPLSSVTVCICTYKRTRLLRRLLEALLRQDIAGKLWLRVVVADNDRERSAEPVVADFQGRLLDITYCMQPEPNIALTRNLALKHARGEFVAFIDDDEFPEPDWLRRHLNACEELEADGVLGPVRPFFEEEPPGWLKRGGFCERAEHQTGSRLNWRETRTGNVLLRRRIVAELDEPFRRELGNGGEDQDFFRRMMEAGHKFVWCNEAVVYEVVPPDRWQRRYLLKRALLRGQNERQNLTASSVLKSLIAAPAYLVLLPFALLAGQHRFMSYAVRLFDHAGKLMIIAGLKPMGAKYLNG